MDLAKKLQITPGADVALLGVPTDVQLTLGEGCRIVDGTAAAEAQVVIAFITDNVGLDAVAAPAITAAREDRLAWVAYPKAGKLGTSLNRDRLAGLMSERGVQPVRQVAIDDVWSALRFRPAG